MGKEAIERSVVTSLDSRDKMDVIDRLNRLAGEYLSQFEEPGLIEKINLKPIDELISIFNLASVKYNCVDPDGENTVSLNMLELLNLIVGRIICAEEIVMECCDEYGDIPYAENGAINIFTKQEYTKDYILAIRRPAHFMLVDRKYIPGYLYNINKVVKPGTEPVKMIVVNNGYEPIVLSAEGVRQFIDAIKCG